MSPLERLQRDVADYLETDPYYADVGIYAIRNKTVQGEADKLLAGLKSKAGKVGVAVLVQIPLLNCDTPNMAGPGLKLSLIVKVQEIPEVRAGARGNKKTAEEVAIHTLQLLNHYNLVGNCGSIMAATDTLTPSLEEDPKLTYECHFRALLPLGQIRKVNTPSIAPGSGAASQLVTLSCSTEGADIYYTTDESLPSPENPLAVLYSEPFAPDCEVLRAAAYLPGSEYMGSNPNQARFVVTGLAAMGPDSFVPVGPEGATPVN